MRQGQRPPRGCLSAQCRPGTSGAGHSDTLTPQCRLVPPALRSLPETMAPWRSAFNSLAWIVWGCLQGRQEPQSAHHRAGKQAPRPHLQPSGSGSERQGFPQRVRLQKLNSRVWPEAIAQVPDVLLPELVQGEKEVVSAGSQGGSVLTPSKQQCSASHQGRPATAPLACSHPSTLSPRWWAH